jgi:hypothetical protein
MTSKKTGAWGSLAENLYVTAAVRIVNYYEMDLVSFCEDDMLLFPLRSIIILRSWGPPVVGYRRTEVGSAPVSDFKEICTAVQYSTLSEKLEYLFFSPRTFQCYFMNIHNKYLGKIFSALCVDVFTELFRIFPNFDIS